MKEYAIVGIAITLLAGVVFGDIYSEVTKALGTVLEVLG